MPSEPMTEPTLEELSAFLDHELDATTNARLAEHVATCADCQARLDGLRQTAYAIRSLPMETPPRSFTVPASGKPRWRWAPVGWIGGVATAMLIVVVGVTHLNFAGPGASSSTASGPQNSSALYSQQRQAAPGAGAAGAAAPADKAFAAANQAKAANPLDSTRSIIAATDSRSYSANATMTVQIYYYGFTPAQVPPPTLLLERNGYAVELATPTQATTEAGGIQGQYAISKLGLPAPVVGSYTLTVIQPLPGGSLATLVVHLPITISG